MVDARWAVPDDAPELVRLRGVMLADVDGNQPPAGTWQQTSEHILRKRLAEPEPERTMAAFVVDQPDRPDQPEPPARLARLAACAIGVVVERLGGPHNPHGVFGYIFNVATDPGYRRRGYSRACMEALIGWYRERDIAVVDLHATEAGEPLYRSLGFEPGSHPPMRLIQR